MAGFSYVLMDNLIHVQVCACAAYNVLFRKHYFNHCEGSLLMAQMECQNMRLEILFFTYVYILQCMYGWFYMFVNSKQFLTMLLYL